jgi:hypothetical protein
MLRLISAGERMPRQANPIDFWRGFALVTIFINHIPGIYYSRFTHANISISDSADLFVFLAGWSLRYVVGSGHARVPTGELVLRLTGRALTLYAAQIMITMIAIGMLAVAALWLGNPLLLEWHNAAAVFHDPVPTHVGLVLLTHQLGYFNILPLYVVLMLMTPGIVVIDRYAPNWLLPISLALYFVTLAVPIRVPSWPVEGEWFFNPLAWQLVFVLGFVLAKDSGIGGVVRQHIGIIRIAGALIVVFAALGVVNNWWHDPTAMPEPRLLFILSKTYVTPIRVIQFLALVAAFSIAFPHIKRFLPKLVDVLALLGRNSLQVFCVGSLLSLAGQISRYVYRDYGGADTAVVIIGILIMVLTAWLSERRDHARAQTPAPSPAASRALLMR